MPVAYDLDFHNRHYDPRTGRFISEDPIDFGGQDANLYRYVKNNPLIFIDSNGKSKEIWHLIYAGATIATLYAIISYLMDRMENETRTEYVPETSYNPNMCGPPSPTTVLVPRRVPDQDAINRNKERLKKIQKMNEEINFLLGNSRSNRDLA